MVSKSCLPRRCIKEIRPIFRLSEIDRIAVITPSILDIGIHSGHVVLDTKDAGEL
jgi:hypothetical protein